MQNACFTDPIFLCISRLKGLAPYHCFAYTLAVRQPLQHVEGHDGRSLSSHCWRMEPATGDWQARWREWGWF